MAFTITINKEKRRIEIRHCGFSDVTEHHHLIKKIIEVKKNTKINKVLIHYGNTLINESMTVNDIYSIGKAFKRNELFDIIFSLVMPSNIKSQNRIYFLVHLIKIRGIDIRSHYHEHDAIRRLTNG